MRRSAAPVFAAILIAAAPVAAQEPTCKFVCAPTFLVEPTITFEEDDTVFETIFALDLVDSGSTRGCHARSHHKAVP